MAFWGVEVKSGKPVIHSCENARGRLRISQATLGISDATKKSILQCNIGKRSPVLLCVLLPNQTESCHLELEFEEADDVVFSVIGPRSVHLTGYYVNQSQRSSPHSDSESYGVDIEHSQTDESSYQSDDDKYEDSFIDEDEQKISPFPVLSSEDETTSETHRPTNGKCKRRRLKKNSQVVESDDASSHESEDDDGYLLSIFSKNKKTEKATSASIEANNISQNAPTNTEEDQMHYPDVEKAKNKRKEHPKLEKTCELNIVEGYSVPEEDKRNKVETLKNLDSEVHQLVPQELDSGDCRKSKRRKQLHPKRFKEEIGVEVENAAKHDNFDQGLLHTDSKKDVSATKGDQDLHIDNDISKFELLDNASQPEKKVKKKTKKKKPQSNRESDMGLTDAACGQETMSVKYESPITDAEPMQNRTLSNGLVIEEVVNGLPDGKVASLGKKVKIFYTGTVKENGHIFDTNVGKSPFKFRLGNKEIIDGWNLGIEGMHVGDKRRLIIPPSMGFGEHGIGENVPPNSWLVYDIELVGVYR